MVKYSEFSDFLKVRLIFILLIKAIVLAFIIGYSSIGLSPDEAQYWTWSQDLDLGYYSKPPAIAWQIWLTSSIFGNTVFGVRFGALLIGFLFPLAVFSIAKAAVLSDRTCFWSAIVAAFSPLGIYISFVATTDGAMILFMTLAIACIVRGIENENGPRYLLTGFTILCAALFKWTAFVFWPVVVGYLFFSKIYEN